MLLTGFFSVQGLLPDTTYDLTVADATSETTKTFTTEHESVLLNVRDFGARGDGKSEDTGFLQAAILSCPEDGTVLVPEGTYLTRPIFLKSHMSLWLEKGAVLLGDPDRRHYPILPGLTKATDGEDEYNLTSWEGNPETSFASLITAIGQEDFDIFGEGTLDGNEYRVSESL